MGQQQQQQNVSKGVVIPPEPNVDFEFHVKIFIKGRASSLHVFTIPESTNLQFFFTIFFSFCFSTREKFSIEMPIKLFFIIRKDAFKK